MGCFKYLRDKIWQMFGWNRKKVGPAAETSMDFPGIDPKDLELKVFVNSMSGCLVDTKLLLFILRF